MTWCMSCANWKGRIARKGVALSLEDNHSDDEWITEVVNKENVDQTDDTNVALVGNSSKATSDIFEVEKAADYDEEPFFYIGIFFEVEKALIIMLKKLLSREEFDDDNVGYDIDDGEDDVARGLDIWRHNHMFF